MELLITKPDGTTTNVKGTLEEIKDFFGVSDLPNSLDEPVEGVSSDFMMDRDQPGIYAVADGWTPEYLTTGKYYKVTEDSGELFRITDNEGEPIYCLWVGCPHLEGGNWRKVVVE